MCFFGSGRRVKTPFVFFLSPPAFPFPRFCIYIYIFFFLNFSEAEVTADATAGDDDPSRTFSVTKSGVRFKDLKIGSGKEVRGAAITMNARAASMRQSASTFSTRVTGSTVQHMHVYLCGTWKCAHTRRVEGLRCKVSHAPHALHLATCLTL